MKMNKLKDFMFTQAKSYLTFILKITYTKYYYFILKFYKSKLLLQLIFSCHTILFALNLRSKFVLNKHYIIQYCYSGNIKKIFVPKYSLVIL